MRLARWPSSLNLSWCALIYLHIMSALPDWKSHGATSTRSLSLIHILLFILPRIRQVLTLPSMHFTIILSPPTNLITRPNSSPCWGNTNSLRWDSLNTFLLPISKTYRNKICNMNLKDYPTSNFVSHRQHLFFKY